MMHTSDSSKQAGPKRYFSPIRWESFPFITRFLAEYMGLAHVIDKLRGRRVKGSEKIQQTASQTRRPRENKHTTPVRCRSRPDLNLFSLNVFPISPSSPNLDQPRSALTCLLSFTKSPGYGGRALYHLPLAPSHLLDL